MTILEKQQQHFTKNYDDEHLPAIFIDQGCEAEDQLKLPKNLSLFDLTDTIKLIKNARLTLLLAANQLTQSSVIKALQDAADRGIRIYIYLGNEDFNKEVINSLASRCLLRFGTTQHGALVITDHATFTPSGYMFSGSSLFVHKANDENRDNIFAIKLNKEQISDSYRSFCHLFWHDSQKEVLKQGISPKPSSCNPSGDIILNHNYNLPNKILENIKNTGSFSLGQINHHSIDNSLSQLILTADQCVINLSKAKYANEVIKNGKHVALTELDIPNIVSSNNESWFIPDKAKNDHINWCTKLEVEQASYLIRSIKETLNAAQWQLSTSTTVNDLASAIIFADEPTTEYICDEKLNIDLKPVYTKDIDSFLNDEIEALTENQTSFQRTNLARDINYSVEKHPPYCPEGANADKLYSQWNKAKQSWLSALSDLESTLNDSNNKRTGLAANIESLLNKFSLGQQIKHKKLIKHISTLRDKDMVTATPAERFEVQKQYIVLFSDISQDNDNTIQAIEKAKLEQQWNVSRSRLEKRTVENEKILSMKKQDFDALKNSAGTKNSELLQQYEQSWKELFFQLPEKQQESLRTKELSSPTEAEQWLKREKNNKKFKEFKRIVESYHLQSKKLSREITARDKDYNDAKKAYETIKESLLQHGVEFIYSPRSEADELAKQLGNSTSVRKAKIITWPSEELPINDELKLLEYKNERYLTFSTLALLETAKKDATRLKAKLCAPINSNKG